MFLQIRQSRNCCATLHILCRFGELDSLLLLQQVWTKLLRFWTYRLLDHLIVAGDKLSEIGVWGGGDT